MSTKLFSAEIEKRLLRAYCSPTSVTRVITNGLTPEHFSTDVCKLAFERVKFMQAKRGKLVSWRDLLADPTLPSAVRSSLKECRTKPPSTEERAKALFNTADTYRKLRQLNNLSRSISEELQQDVKKDVDLLLENVARQFSKITDGSGEVQLVHMGKGDNSEALVAELLKGTKQNFVPTGLKAFDDRAHGIELGAEFLIVGSTGAGKSIIMQALSENFALQGIRVLFAPLEMGQNSQMQRSLARSSGLQLSKIINPKRGLTQKEKDFVLKKHKSLSRRIRQAGGKLTVMTPGSEGSASQGLKLETILSFAKTANYRIVMIDYVGLLDGTDGDDQVRALGRITRMAKLWAEANRSIVVFAAQLNDDGKIKYSRAMSEHCVTGDMRVTIDGVGSTVQDLFDRYTKQELVGRSILTATGYRKITQAYAFGPKDVIEFTAQRRDGTTRTVKVSTTTPMLTWNNRENKKCWARAQILRIGHTLFMADPVEHLVPLEITGMRWSQAPVFDFTVDEDRASVDDDSPLCEGHFIANGIVVHNSNNLWQFTRSPLDKENRILRIHQTKSRMNEDFSFELFFDPATMTVRDLTPEEAKRIQASAQAGSYGSGKDKKTKKKGKGGGFSSKYSSDIS